MAEQTRSGEVLRELWFWSGVFRDHAAFIYDHLAPSEKQAIEQANRFKQALTQLENEVEQTAKAAGISGPAGSYALADRPQRAPLARFQGHELTHYEQMGKRYGEALLAILGPLREFKQEIVQRKLDCTIKLGLGPTLVQHMLNELEEAQATLRGLREKVLGNPATASLHHHLLWLPDASGHAAALNNQFDGPEQQLKAATQSFKHLFDGLHIRALELDSMLRVAPRMVGALRRLNADAMHQIASFRQFLTELREHSEECEFLGTIMPLLADHMVREELYYTEKLASIPTR